jgi:hypothetical protein
LKFDSEANLQTWLSSTERNNLLEQAAAFTDEYHIRVVRTGFDQWFEVGVAGASSPPAWRQNMIVLLMLYPVVFLITAWLEHPFLVGQLKMLHWSALFVDNVVSVFLLSVVVSWASRRFDWWLRPAGRDPKREIAGVALVLSFYALSWPRSGNTNCTSGGHGDFSTAIDALRTSSMTLIYIVTKDAHDVDDMVMRACKLAGREGFAKAQDRIIIVAGVPFGTPGATNMIRIAVLDADSK